MRSFPQFQEIQYHSDKITIFEKFLFSKDTHILSRQDVEELRTLATPTTHVKHIFQAFCMLLQLKPKRLPRPDGSISNDYTLTFQKFV